MHQGLQRTLQQRAMPPDTAPHSPYTHAQVYFKLHKQISLSRTFLAWFWWPTCWPPSEARVLWGVPGRFSRGYGAGAGDGGPNPENLVYSAWGEVL